MSKIHNFSAGPSILPSEVFQEASRAVIDFNGSGLSLLEMSHRSKPFVAVMEEAQQLVKDIYELGDDYEVLFLQGGASLGFLMSAYNMARENKKAAYINTGEWANKAQKEAARLLNVVEAGSSKDSNYSFIPKALNIPSDADFLHFTSNNTIFGTQFQQFPKTNLPVVCDMSSDIFSRVIDAKQFDLIYAGAQKNMGPAGTTVYIVKKSALGKSSLSIPTMLDLQTHAKAESMFNTPPVFAVYVSMLVLRWIKKTGLVQIEKNNTAKANLLYGEIDRSSVFKGTSAVEDRSKMNITFVLNDGVDVAHEETFLAMCKSAKVDGLKGHRSVGGFRASCYNALPLDSVQALVNVMQEFENKVK